MNRRDLIILGSTLSLVTLSLVFSMFYPVMSAAQNKRPKKPIPAHGLVKAYGLGVYWDQSCANSVSSIDWGILDPGSKTNKTVYIRNQGDANVTLSMGTANWSPSNSSAYISVVWDYGGQPLAVGEVIAAKFTLSISESAQEIRDFSFDTVMAAA